jgi:hypothetical protein
MALSFVFFIVGICDIAWGFWGDFIDITPNPSPSISSRFESGIIFLALSLLAYVIAKRKKKVQVG